MAADEEHSDRSATSCHHEDFRIALYYSYVVIQDVDRHVNFHRTVCEARDLKGRIRVATEGINGVLSGTYANLLEYTQMVDKELHVLKSRDDGSSATNTNEIVNDSVSSTTELLEIKYCLLRPELPVSKQLFDKLSVQITREVVSLYEPQPGDPWFYRNQTKKRIGRRRQRQRQRQQPDSTSSNIHGEGEKEQMLMGRPSENELLRFAPATHLTPAEWNDALKAHQQNSILLDARNVYESRVGHFVVPGVPTLLTNTRKFSFLPKVLESSLRQFSGKHVFMYCTGGVRCERASVLLQALAEKHQGEVSLSEKPLGIYQLHGGIQRYLEEYGSMPDTLKDTCKEANSAPETDATTLGSQENTNTSCCFYKGKNFVFDPRRTDPLVDGKGSVIGRCSLCRAPHDDYDNGHAPCEYKEARCCHCRVLVLVCNSCRLSVRSFGEAKDDSTKSTDLFCGGKECITEEVEVVLHDEST